MVKKIKIITDSTADLPAEYSRENDIHVIPLYVNFPHATYQDRVDLSPQDFYPLLQNAGSSLPKTSTPTSEDFSSIYKRFIEEEFDILSIHISAGLSSTFSIAQTAARTISERIRVFDSKSISLGIGLQVREAVQMIKQGLNLQEIVASLQEMRHRTEVLFSLDTLEYLQKGGRIGKVSALLGNILNIKPIIRVEDGIYVPLDKVRNQKQAVKKMAEHMSRILQDKKPHCVAVAHGAAEEAAHCLKELLESTFQTKIAFLEETGPVIGVHTGPGTLGLAFNY